MMAALALICTLLGLATSAGAVVGSLAIERHLAGRGDMRQAATLHRVLPTLLGLGWAGAVLLAAGGLLDLTTGPIQPAWIGWLLAELAWLALLWLSQRLLHARMRLIDHLAGGQFRRDTADRLQGLNQRVRLLLAGQTVAILVAAGAALWPLINAAR